MVTAATTTPTTIVVARYQHSLISDASSIVGPMESILAILVVDVTTRNMAIKIVLHTPIKWVVSLGTELVGAVLSLPEMIGGKKIQ